MHTVYDPEADTPTFFELTTARVNDCKAVHNLTIMPGVTCVFDRAWEDQIIRLSSDKGRKACPTDLRRVRIRREEDGRVLTFISNDLSRTAVEIAALYKSHWQIELFFKWIKQNLKIKRFIGRSENAAKIQVLTAMIACLLLRLVQLNYPDRLSLQQIARKINLNLMTK